MWGTRDAGLVIRAKSVARGQLVLLHLFLVLGWCCCFWDKGAGLIPPVSAWPCKIRAKRAVWLPINGGYHAELGLKRGT